MNGPVREGKDVKPQAFDGEATFERLKDLVSRFLKGEQDDINVKFDNYLKITRDEFNDLPGDYEIGGYNYTNTFINGKLIYKGTYTYYVGDNEVAPSNYIVTSKIIHIIFHKEKDNGTTLYAIHRIEGFTFKAGIRIEHYD